MWRACCLQAGAVGGDVAKNTPDGGDIQNAGSKVADKVGMRGFSCSMFIVLWYYMCCVSPCFPDA